MKSLLIISLVLASVVQPAAAATTACPAPATPTALAATVTSQSTALLTWHDNATNEAFYRVARLDPGEDPNNPAQWDNVSLNLPANTTSFSVGGLTPGKTYKFKVRCQAGCGT